MKRYLSVIIIAMISITVIGAFYIQAALANDQYPQFSIEKVKGDEAAVENLVLYGDYKKGNSYESFRIINNQSEYYSEASIVEKAFGTSEPKFKSLIKEYRNFMRGKSPVSVKYYEDENVLVYGDVKWKEANDFTFEIAMLDKNSKETFSMSQDVPEENLSFSNLVDVQINDHQHVQLVVQNYMYSQEEERSIQEFRVYTFDVAKKQLVDNNLITSIPMPTGNMIYENSRFIGNPDYTGKQKDILIKRYVADQAGGFDEEGNPANEPAVIMNDYVIYNLETEEAEIFTIPEELAETVSLESIHQSKIYFSSITDKGVEVTPYQIESKSFGESVVFAAPAQTTPSTITFYKDKIYIIYSSASVADKILTIGNADTGEVLYEGTIKDTNPSTKDQSYEMNINTLSVND